MWKAFGCAALAGLLVTGVWAQSTAPGSAAPPAGSAAPDTQPGPASTPSTPPVTPAATQPVPPKTVEVPAGTKVLLALRSGVNTKTAQSGDGVYLSSSFPVVVDNRVVIPSGAYVQGVIDSVVRPGRVKGRAQVTMHFTTLIFPNGSVVSIPGGVDSLPGSTGPKVKGGEGTIEQPGSKGKDAGAVLTGAATGAGLGGIAGASSDHAGAGIGYGALAGGVGGLIYTLFTRGNDVALEEGQAIEMVLQRPLLLEQANLSPADGAGFVPAPHQPQALPKPTRRSQVLCPSGTPGCQ